MGGTVLEAWVEVEVHVQVEVKQMFATAKPQVTQGPASDRAAGTWVKHLIKILTVP